MSIKDIKVTSQNSEAIARIAPQKKSLKKKFFGIIITGTIVIGLTIAGYNYVKNDKELNIVPTPIGDIVEDMNATNLGTAIVNGKTINLDKAKKDLGALYYYVEPLSEEEIDSQFMGIVHYMRKIKKVNENMPVDNKISVDGYSLDQYNMVMDSFGKLAHESSEKADNLSDEYAFILDMFNRADYPFNCGQYATGNYSFSKLSSEEKEQFIRDWKYHFSFVWDAHVIEGLDPTPLVELTYNNFNFSKRNAI